MSCPWNAAERPGARTKRIRLTAAALSAMMATAALADEGGGFVRMGQALSELRGAGEIGPELPQEATSESGVGFDSGASLRLVGAVAVVLCTLGGLALFARRRRLRLAASTDGGGLEVVEKLALSSRHWVCVLRVDRRRLIVGVAGDSMSPLAVLDDRPTDAVRQGEALQPGEARAPQRVGGLEETQSTRETPVADEVGSKRAALWFRPGETPAGKGGRWEHRLAPYRREVNRLRDMLQDRLQSDGREAEEAAREGRQA